MNQVVSVETGEITKVTQLVRYDAMRHAVQVCAKVDEAKDIADRAAALLAYARQRKDPEMASWLAEIKLRAQRRIGELSKALDTAQGERTDLNELLPELGKKSKAESLKAANLSTSEANRCEQLADVPQEVFDSCIAEAVKAGEEVAASEVVSFLQSKVKKEKRRAEINSQVVELAKATPETPIGLFHVISIDPPWPYRDGIDQPDYDPQGHRASNPYPEMELSELEALNIPAADDCVLWLWTTHKFMRHAFPLLDRWGFTDRAILTWAKDRMGLGRWLRSQSEFCIMATRGKPLINLTNQTTILNGPMREHSRKPDEFYAMVDTLCTGRKLDFFSRELREGWEQFGNDKQRFAVG